MTTITEKRKRHRALIDGLDTVSARDICAASYVMTTLNGFPSFEDDYEYRIGHGIQSTTLLHNLPVLLDQDEETDYPKEAHRGAILADHDIRALALHLYHEDIDDEEAPLALEKDLAKRNVDRLDATIDELEKRINDSP